MQHVEIRVRGQIDRAWSDWFDDLTISYTPEGDTVLDGNLPDQAAIYGVLSKLRDLGMQLISVVPKQ